MSHAHAVIIKAIGRQVIIDHFGCTRRTIELWQRNGIPKGRHNAVRLLAQTRSVQIPELS